MKQLPSKPTVQDLIDILMLVEDKSRIVCIEEYGEDELEYCTVELIGLKESKNYIDNDGNHCKGNIVSMC